ncbi:MAG: hypothetical protein RLZZ488_1259 [Pseudomonadota bacterium]
MRLLREAAAENNSLMLAEKNARMTALSRQYREVLEQPDFAATAQLATEQFFDSSGGRAKSAEIRLDGIFQFASNWQTEFAWLSTFNFGNNAGIERQTPSEIPSLNHLSLSYGRNRSVEVKAGLLDDRPLLRGRQTQPVFSSVSLVIHPLSQMNDPNTSVVQFELEHGWNTFRTDSRKYSSQEQIQRTRPRLNIAKEAYNWRSSGTLALEWYSDGAGLLGQVIAQRKKISAQKTLLSAAAERRWRLFSIELENSLRGPADTTMTATLQRASNSIGKSTRPAWSATLTGEKIVQLNSGMITAIADVQFFEAPFGALPQARLPMEINPGTRGQIGSLQVNWQRDMLKKETLSVAIGFMQEVGSDDLGWDHCGRSSRVGTTNPCRSGWVTLAWSLKLPTNL